MSHRNEPARSRRRSLLKQQLSLRSIPLVEAPSETYNLENHFGWKVLQKCRIGEGSFPHYLLHCIYCDKPDVPGRDDGEQDKVMYVLYIRGKDGELKPVDAKETQTAMPNVFSTIIEPTPILESAAPVGPPPSPVMHKGKGFKRSAEKSRVISQFYYIPIKERVMSRYDIKLNESGEYVIGNPELLKTSSGKKGKKGKRGRSSPKGWQFRAGAENFPENFPEWAGDTTDTSDESSEEESDVEEEDEIANKFINNLKKPDCTACFTKPSNEKLMESPMERNKYLYLPQDRYVKHPPYNNDQGARDSE